jgi:hypothetical protein
LGRFFILSRLTRFSSAKNPLTGIRSFVRKTSRTVHKQQ